MTLKESGLFSIMRCDAPLCPVAHEPHVQMIEILGPNSAEIRLWNELITRCIFLGVKGATKEFAIIFQHQAVPPQVPPLADSWEAVRLTRHANP